MSDTKTPKKRSGLRHLLREAVMPVYLVAERWRQTIVGGPKGTYPVVHHGIQRSGTNFLCSVLEKGDYKVLNKIDPHQSNPRHKHARWQAEKSTIVMDRRYVTPHVAQDIVKLNAICGYAPEQKHIVQFRSPRSWINSTYRWGLDNGWFASTDAFLDEALYAAYLTEWHAYYAAWAEMARANPDQVMILAFEDLKADPTATLAAIDAFMGVERETPVDLSAGIDKVRHSAPITQKRIDLDDPRLDAAVARDGAFDWHSFIGTAS